MIVTLFAISGVCNLLLVIWLVHVLKYREESESLLKGFKAMYYADQGKLEKAQKRVAELEMAITVHMKAKGHDRCWLNDLELYRVIDPKFDKMRLALPCLPEFLHNCSVYWRDSQPPEARKLGG